LIIQDPRALFDTAGA